MQNPAMQSLSSERQFSYTSEDFQWPSFQNCVEPNRDDLSKLDKEIKETWDAAADAGYFTYRLDRVEGRVVPGKYSLVIQLNELRFTKRRKPVPMNRVSEPFNPAKFNFTKVHSKEVLFELKPKHRTAEDSDQHLVIINKSPQAYGNSLLVPRINSCLPQTLTEEALLLSLETAMLTNHRGFRLGFNSLCAYSSVNHLHFHIWLSESPSYLEVVDVIPVCEDVFEVRDYATTTFVFELGPQTNACLLARKIHQVSSYFVTNEVAHTYVILRGNKCSSKTQNGESVNQMCDHSVIRVFLWPRNPVCGSQVKSSYGSDELPMAVCELSGFVVVGTREVFNSFTEEQFCKEMKKATLSEEEFTRHRQAIQELLNK